MRLGASVITEHQPPVDALLAPSGLRPGSQPNEHIARALQEILDRRSVHTVFQPIIRIGSGEIIGYESLSRPPPGAPFADATELFNSAIRHCLITELELLCFERALERFAQLKLEVQGVILAQVAPPPRYAG